MFCQQCGKENSNQEKFCGNCGTKTSATDSALDVSSNAKIHMENRMSFTDSIATCFEKYFNFNGRATRAEYWWFYLFCLLLNWGAGIAFSLTIEDTGIRAICKFLFIFVLLVPQLSACARRLHDTGKSGWRQMWVFTIIGIIPLIIWLANKSSPQENEYGPPKLRTALD